MNLLILANYFSQLYSALIGILIIPSYLALLGPDAIGLIGIFTMLQNLFLLLDSGLTPTVMRETAKLKSQPNQSDHFGNLLRTIETICVFTVFVGSAGAIFLLDYFASSWLKSNSLSISEIRACLFLMILISALKLLSGVYRAVIQGLYDLNWLSSITFCIATLKYIGVLPALHIFGSNPTVFFKYQLFVALLELFGYFFRAYFSVFKSTKVLFLPSNIKQFKSLVPFAANSTLLALNWVLLSQLDKALLSKMLPLNEFGTFSISIQAAMGITILAAPVSTFIMPRLSKLWLEKEVYKLQIFFKFTSQCFCCLIMPVSISLLFFSENILFAWTGDSILARSGARILSFYSLGNLFLVIRTFAWYLLFAAGDLKRHVLGQIVFSILITPCFYFSALNYGAVGSSFFWFIGNLIYLLIWTPIEFRRISNSLYFEWLKECVVTPAIGALLPVIPLFLILNNSLNRFQNIVLVCLFLLISSVSAIFLSKMTRQFCFDKLQKWKSDSLKVK